MAAQYEWLQKDLQKAVDNRDNIPWIVMFGHRPMYCSNVDDLPDFTKDTNTLRNGVNNQLGMEQLLFDFKVDIYLSGHEHSYERSYPVYNGTYQKDQKNHTYLNPIYPSHLVAGSAGCPEDLDYFAPVLHAPWSAVRSSTYGYGHLTIFNETHIHWRQLADDPFAKKWPGRA